MKKKFPQLRLARLILPLYLLLASFNFFAQTPGVIFEGADPNSVLDPNGDGYVSLPPSQTPSQFVNVGFPANTNATDVFDVLYSEIAYEGIPEIILEPTGDLTKGPVCSFTELVQDANSRSTYYNRDGVTNMRFRFRLGGAAPNSKGYSILIDTDQKFGFTGPNKDPNAMVGNPGFEIEIVLRTNFEINAYNVDGTITPGDPIATAPYATNAIKSIALTTVCDDPDYFYDFYLPFSAIAGIDATTKIRMVSLTSINPKGAIGNNGTSDIGGVDDQSGAFDTLFENAINAQTPTNDAPIVRASCPLITGGNTLGSLINGDTQVTGTSLEEDGTLIEVFIGGVSAGTTTVVGNNWTLTGLSLTTGSVVTATATVPSTVASGIAKGTSTDNCDVETVLFSACIPPATPVTVEVGNSGKSLNGTIAGINDQTVLIRIFNNGTELTSWGKAAIDGATGYFPVTISSTGTWAVEGGGGYKAPSGYYSVIIIPTNTSCPSATSNSFSYCVTNGGGDGVLSSTITLDTPAQILTSTTSISGTLGTATATTVKLFKNDAFTGISGTFSSTAWSLDISSLNLVAGDVVYVSNKETPATCTSVSLSKTVIEKSKQPRIAADFCVTGNLTTVTGSASELGGTITLYSKTTPGVTTLDTFRGTTTVSANGSWTLTGLSIPASHYLAATVQNAGETVSDLSNEVLINEKTIASSLVITSDPIQEGDASITGTSAGLPTGATIQLYLDDAKIDGATGLTDASGNWTIANLTTPFDQLYTDAVVTVTATSTVAGSCESDQSSSKVVICVPPASPTITAVSAALICLNNTFTVTIQATQTGIAYQLLDQNDTAVGPTVIGNGAAINVVSDPLAESTTTLKVRAFKIIGNCTSTMSNALAIAVNPSPTITLGANPSATQSSNAQTVNLSYTATVNSPNEYTIDFDAAANTAGLVDVAYTSLPATPIAIAVPANLAVGVYNATFTIREPANGCERSYPITITITDATTPSISLTNSTVTLCSGVLNASFAYSGTTVSPDLYSINFNDAANLSGFTDIVDAALPATPISVTVPATTTGGTFTGILTVKNSTTGNVSIEYPISITIQYTNPGVIAGDQVVISGAAIAAFTSVEDATGSETISYQWQKSTTSATAGFTPISNTDSNTFDEGTITQTTYYKRIATNSDTGCASESNVIRVKVPVGLTGIPMITQVFQFGNEKWIEVTNISANTINANTISLQLYRDTTRDQTGKAPTATYVISTELAPGASVLIKNTLGVISNINGTPLVDNTVTDLEGANDMITLSTTNDTTSWENRYDIVAQVPNKTSLVRIDEATTTNTVYNATEWVPFIDDALSTTFTNVQRHVHAALISEITGANAEANALLGKHRIGATTRTGAVWNNGLPDRSRKVIIAENYQQQSETLPARKLEVQGTSILAIDNQLLLVSDEVNIADAAEIRLVGSSQLIQTHTGGADITGNGKLYVEQNSDIASIYRFNYMSSPVTTPSLNTYSVATVLKDGTNPVSFTGVVGQGASNIARAIDFVGGFDGSVATPIKIADYWIYTFASAKGSRSGYVQQRQNGLIKPADGFLLKGPGVAQNYTFVGNPNDGEITTFVGGSDSYILGNPFASSLNALKFIQDNINSIDGTLYLWDHVGEEDTTTTTTSGHGYSGYVGGYATINLSMSVPALSASTAGAFSITLEAENATTDGTLGTDADRNIITLANSQQLTFNSITKATDEVTINYKSNTSKTIALSVNNVLVSTYTLGASATYTSYTITTCIPVGSNISIASSDADPIVIDNLVIADADGTISCVPSSGSDATAYRTPGSYIAIGQGFFIGGDPDGGPIVFNNSQREYVAETPGNAVFFKGSKKANKSQKESSNTNRLPLVKLGMDFVNDEGLRLHRQIGVSFSAGNSFKYEKGYESAISDLGSTDVYWKFPNDPTPYVIAGVQEVSESLAVPFDIKMNYSGSVVMTIDEVENITQNIFIKDKLTGFNHPISTTSSSALTLEAGVYTDRFVLVFSNDSVLNMPEDSIAATTLTTFVDNSNQVIVINNPKNFTIKEVRLYSLLGKEVTSWTKNLNLTSQNSLKFPQLPTGVYIVNIATEAQSFSKKIVIE